MHIMAVCLDATCRLTAGGSSRRLTGRTGHTPACRTCRMASSRTAGGPWSAVQQMCDATQRPSLCQLSPVDVGYAWQLIDAAQRSSFSTETFLGAGVLHLHRVSIHTVRRSAAVYRTAWSHKPLQERAVLGRNHCLKVFSQVRCDRFGGGGGQVPICRANRHGSIPGCCHLHLRSHGAQLAQAQMRELRTCFAWFTPGTCTYTLRHEHTLSAAACVKSLSGPARI